MENTITQELRNNYMLKFYSHVQELTETRKNLRINQNTMSVKCGVSLRTIQNFENYRTNDYFLIYAYKQILSNENKTKKRH